MLFLRVDIPRTPRGNEMRYILQDLNYTARVMASATGIVITGQWPSLSAQDVDEVILALQRARIQHLHLKENGQGANLLSEGELVRRVWP